MKCGDEGEGSTGTGRFENQLPGHRQHKVAAGSSADGEGLLWEDKETAKGNTELSVKPKGVES